LTKNGYDVAGEAENNAKQPERNVNEPSELQMMEIVFVQPNEPSGRVFVTPVDLLSGVTIVEPAPAPNMRRSVSAAQPSAPEIAVTEAATFFSEELNAFILAFPGVDDVFFGVRQAEVEGYALAVYTDFGIIQFNDSALDLLFEQTDDMLWIHLSNNWFNVHLYNSDFAYIEYNNSDYPLLVSVDGINGYEYDADALVVWHDHYKFVKVMDNALEDDSVLFVTARSGSFKLFYFE
jgi:hypothetical protein